MSGSSVTTRLTDRAKTSIYPIAPLRSRRLDTSMMQTTTDTQPSLGGLWVLLVKNEGELATQDNDGRVPVMARAGNDQTYLLVFKDVAKARKFVASQDLDGAEPRMVVRGNRDDIVRIARSAGVVGTMLDYDPTTQKYASTGALA